MDEEATINQSINQLDRDGRNDMSFTIGDVPVRRYTGRFEKAWSLHRCLIIKIVHTRQSQNIFCCFANSHPSKSVDATRERKMVVGGRIVVELVCQIRNLRKHYPLSTQLCSKNLRQRLSHFYQALVSLVVSSTLAYLLCRTNPGWR